MYGYEAREGGSSILPMLFFFVNAITFLLHTISAYCIVEV